MAQVYSKRFAEGVQAGGILANLFTVPANRTYVLRDMSFTPLDAPPIIYQVKVGGVTIDARYSITTYVPIHWEGRVVLVAGDVLALGTGGVLGWEYIINGYDLAD